MRIGIIALVLLAALQSAGVAFENTAFHIFAPSRSTESLLVIQAQTTISGLRLEKKEPIKLGFPAATIVAHPTKPLLYVSSPRGKNVKGAVIRLNEEGGYASHQDVPFHNGYAYLSLDRTSRYLLGVSYFGGQVDVYALDESGMPTQRVTALDEGRLNAHCVLLSPDNKWVYIPYVKQTNAIYQYRFDDKTGGLTALTPKNVNPPEVGPRHMAYHPKKPFAYFSNEQHLGVTVFERRPNGQLKLKQVCNAVPDSEPKDGVSSSDIVITPDGKYLFAGIRGHKRQFDWISRYRVEADGSVTHLGLTAADKIPWGLALSPDGRFLLATGFQGASLMAFHINDAGDLSRVATLKWDPQISDIVTRSP